MTDPVKVGSIDLSRQFIDQPAISRGDIFDLAIKDAKAAAGITTEPYFVRVVVRELPSGGFDARKRPDVLDAEIVGPQPIRPSPMQGETRG